MQTASPLGLNDNVKHEGNISKMLDFDVLSLLAIRQRKSRSHGKRQKGNDKCKRFAAQKSNTTLNDLSTKSRYHALLPRLSSLPIPVLRILMLRLTSFESGICLLIAPVLVHCFLITFIYFYDRNHQNKNV